MLKDTTRFDPSGARTPTSGSGVRGINHQTIALPPEDNMSLVTGKPIFGDPDVVFETSMLNVSYTCIYDQISEKKHRKTHVFLPSQTCCFRCRTSFDSLQSTLISITVEIILYYSRHYSVLQSALFSITVDRILFSSRPYSLLQ